jgi:hypothetical protein
MNRILTDEETRRLKVENVRHQIVNFYPEYIDPYLRVGGLNVLAIGAGNAPEIVWAISRGARSIHATSLHLPDESWKSIAEEIGIHWEGRVTTGVLDVCKDHLDKEFDTIIGINCWEHLPDPQQCLMNCLQMLKDGGLLFIFSCPFYWSSDGSHFGRYRESDPWVHLSKDNEELKQNVSAHEWRQYNTLNKINVSQTWEYTSQMPMIFEDFAVLPDLHRSKLPSLISIFSQLPHQPIDLTVRGVRFALRRSKTLEQHLRTNFHSRRNQVMTQKEDLESLMKFAITTKLELIDKVEEVETVLEYGGVWRVDMLYLKYCLNKGALSGIEVDNLPPITKWPEITFLQGDFRDSSLLEQTPQADLVLLYDIILHQANVMHTFRSLIAKAKKYVAFNQPMFDIPGHALPNAMFYLPGSDLSKYGVSVGERGSLKVEKPEDFGPHGLDNPNKWHWAMSPDIVRTWFRFLGFRIVHEAREKAEVKWLGQGWVQWGCLAERV